MNVSHEKAPVCGRSGETGNVTEHGEDNILAPACQSGTVSEIVKLHDEIMGAARSSLDKAIRIGELLTLEKDRLEHGHWLPWIKSNVPFSDRTARNYIRCFEQRDRLKLESVSDLTSAYRMLSNPDRPDDLIRELPDAETLAGSDQFERFHAESMALLQSAMEQLKTSSTVGQVIEHKREADRLLQFWSAATLNCERSLGLCLNEIEKLKERKPGGAA